MTQTTDHPVVVIGAGGWGAAIATALVRAGTATIVLARNAQNVDALAKGLCLRLPDSPPAVKINATTDPACLKKAKLIFVAVPVGANQTTFALINEMQADSPPGAIILCAKGIASTPTGQAMLLTELAQSMLPQHPLAVFSGPSFADEVFAGLPAALVVASRDAALAKTIQASFEGSNLRVYSNDDPIGVTIAGAMKNVIAIAAGCAVGAGYGDNAKAAILTRGLAETARFASFMGAKNDTIYGLAGVGDLALTTAGPHSRNMAFGIALGRAETPPTQLAEGSRTVAHLAQLAKAKGMDLPLTAAVDKLVNDGQDLHNIVAALLARRVGSE